MTDELFNNLQKLTILRSDNNHLFSLPDTVFEDSRSLENNLSRFK